MAVGVERRRLPIPADCPPPLAKLLKECWRHNAPLRPTFRHLPAALLLLPTRCGTCGARLPGTSPPRPPGARLARREVVERLRTLKAQDAGRLLPAAAGKAAAAAPLRLAKLRVGAGRAAGQPASPASSRASTQPAAAAAGVPCA